MPRVVVVGAGFAGVWSALAASRAVRDHDAAGRLEVAVIAPNSHLVLRPRLYQDNPEQHRVPLAEMFEPAGVRHVRGSATRIDHRAKTVTITGTDGGVSDLAWDRLVLASGSQLTLPQVGGAGRIHNVDSLAAAQELEAHLGRLARNSGAGRWTALVVGSGFTGLEVATELLARLRRFAAATSAGQEPRVVLLEQHGQVGPTLGPGPRTAILRQLAEAGVELHLGDVLRSYDGANAILASGSRIEAATVVWTVGMAASPLTAQLPGERDALGRIEVDGYLRVPHAVDVFVAGDTAAAMADETHVVTQSCQFAIPMGKTAGWNAAIEALATGEALVQFRPSPYVTCLDLGQGGAVFATGWERTVQRVGAEAKQLKTFINELIRPPVEDPDALLEQAHPSWAPQGLALA